MTMPLESRFAGSLIGQCLGDALGFPVEGTPPDVCRSYVEEVITSDRVEGVAKGEFPFGQYSDDSQLAREFLQSYAACGRFVPEDYAGRIAAIFREERIVGRGMATEAAALRLMAGAPWEETGAPPPSAGNGSAMRAGPVGLLFFDDPETLVRVAHDQGRITHQDRRCSAGAVAIAGAVALVLQEGDIVPEGFAATLAEWTRPFDPVLANSLLEMPEIVLLHPDEAVKRISHVGIPADRHDGWRGISPFVTPSVLWSIYAFLRHPDDYMEAICTAIAVGGDVDTTAAMTGAISGARVGLAALPAHLTRRLNDRGRWGYDDLVALARACCRIKAGTPAGSLP